MSINYNASLDTSRMGGGGGGRGPVIAGGGGIVGVIVIRVLTEVARPELVRLGVLSAPAASTLGPP